MIVGVDVKSAGLDRLVARLAGITNLADRKAVAPLVDKEGPLFAVIVEDNRRGVMAGQDKDGRPAPPLKYRNASAIQSAPRPRGYYGGQGEGSGTGRFKGAAPATGRILPNNNLRSSQYRKLTGPRLAPRRDSSRIIANLRYQRSYFASGVWWVVGHWLDVFDAKGRKILPHHFQGGGRVPRYDLRGVRPQGVREATAIVVGYFRKMLHRATP